jgi:hypothetical protein
MLVYDLWESGKGALPQIREALKGEEAKNAIRSEITEAIQESLPDQVDAVAYQIAVTLVDQWENFCTEYGGLCQLKDKNPTFAALMAESSLAELDTMRDLVTLYRAELGEKELLAAINSYEFDAILTNVFAYQELHPAPDIPQPSESANSFTSIPIIQMLRAVHSTTDALKWVDLSGGKIDRVLLYDIHLYTSAAEWEAEQLTFVLALPKSRDIEKVLSLPVENRAILFSLPSDSIRTFVTTCSIDKLGHLTGQMLQPGNRPQTIAQEAVDCQWEGAVAVLPPAPPTAAPSPQPTRASVATPVTKPATAQSTLQWLDDLKKLPINTDWSILGFVFVGLFLEISFFSRKLAKSDRKQREEQLSKKSSDEKG